MNQEISTRQDLIKKYIDFFKSKSHKHIPSSSLIPENDPTVLFTTAGMHPLIPYFTGQKHPLGKRLTNVQKCIRTGDIDEVGDSVHHTFFEMLGNWSLDDYWKKDAISFTFNFITSILKLPVEKLAVTCFKGIEKPAKVSKDTESAKIWHSLGISKNRIAFRPKKDNWWGPAGETGPCGPDTEIFYYLGKSKPKNFNPYDEKWIEIGNNVLLQYNKNPTGMFEKLKYKIIDFGGGVERMLSILKNLDDSYKTSLFLPIIQEIEKISKKQYGKNSNVTRSMRIIADHIKAATFILADDKQITPGNLGQGYVLRRLIRRAIRHGKIIGIEKNFTVLVSKSVIPIYPDYQELARNKKFIFEQLEAEENKFRKTLGNGLKQFSKLSKNKIITGKEAFLLFQSYGFPIEMTQELAFEQGVKIDLEEYNKEFQKHQDLSRTAAQGVFKSGLADDSEATKKLHTATHLLNESLRRILGKDVKQKGSNITSQRLRFDFNFPRKLTEEEVKQIENLVNEKINAKLDVISEEIPLQKAIKAGAQSEFGQKYPEMISVYTILDPKERSGWFSKEICTGPHVQNTGSLGFFKIIKEESSAAGTRRIKAVLE